MLTAKLGRAPMALAIVLLALVKPDIAIAQSYDEVEGRVRRQIEMERAQAVGDCSRAMLSWLGMRFTEEQRQQGKAAMVCADAQRFALRNHVPFLEALPRVAVAHGGTRSEVCPPHTDHSPTYMLYSNCHYPQPPRTYTPAPPSAWDLERQREVAEIGDETLRHIRQCVPRANAAFAFMVREDGHIDNFSDRGFWGQTGAPPDIRAELGRIERALRTNPKCKVFPERLRRRYVAVSANQGRMNIDQVRDEAARQ